MLKGRHLAKIDGIKTRFRHGGDDEEERVRVADTLRRVRGAPENDREDHACQYEIGVMDRDEIEGRQKRCDPVDSLILLQVLEEVLQLVGHDDGGV